MLWVVPSTRSPDQHILHVLHQTSVYVVAEVFYSAATSILKQFARESDDSDGLEEYKNTTKKLKVFKKVK